ncbi:MAG: hypothetical protein WAO76_07700 [Georgfuchsia sp.]
MTFKTSKLMNAMLLCGLACCTQSAFSSTTTLNYQGAAYPSYLSGTITYNDGPGGYPSVNEGAYVGGFNMLNTSTNKSLIAWCVDIFDNLQSATYNNGNASSINNIDKLQQLVNQDYSKVNDKETSAAFQLAVWDIVNEASDATSFNLSTGNFKASGTGLSNAILLANDWLQLDEADTGNYNIAYFQYGNGVIPNWTVPVYRLLFMPPCALTSGFDLGSSIRRRFS